jgi:hypothetical protein
VVYFFKNGVCFGGCEILLVDVGEAAIGNAGAGDERGMEIWGARRSRAAQLDVA